MIAQQSKRESLPALQRQIRAQHLPDFLKWSHPCSVAADDSLAKHIVALPRHRATDDSTASKAEDQRDSEERQDLLSRRAAEQQSSSSNAIDLGSWSTGHSTEVQQSN